MRQTRTLAPYLRRRHCTAYPATRNGAHKHVRMTTTGSRRHLLTAAATPPAVSSTRRRLAFTSFSPGDAGGACYIFICPACTLFSP